MDKKERKKNTPTDRVNFYDIMIQTNQKDQSGLITTVYQFLKEYGNGTCINHTYEGLSISILDVFLKENIISEGSLDDSVLELSFLIEGEQIIRISGCNKEFLYESQESYFVYLPKTSGSIHYNAQKYLREIKVRMNRNFIEKHSLQKELALFNINSLLNSNIFEPIPPIKQDILLKILHNKQEGLPKRLFLESQILQLLSLQINTLKREPKPTNLLKKLYEIQSIISSDISKHYSVQELSKIIGLNDFLLKKEFKRVFNKTIFEYLNELRIQKSKELLQHSNKPIYEIAEMVGYKNATHFSAAFKKKVDFSPKKYRLSTN